MSRSFLIEQIVQPDNLRRAFLNAAKGKRQGHSVKQYEAHLDENLCRLSAQIASGEVEVGHYRKFKVFEPKERNICAPSFQEQVLHHALMNVAHEDFERFQIFDSYASRKGKGLHAALERAKIFSQKNEWYLKLDVHRFFDSIPHQIIENQMDKLFADKNLKAIFSKIIRAYEVSPDRGVPIGNLSSQYFANHFLAPLDHFVKEKLRAKFYVRYMDDMVVWHNDNAVLKQMLREIESFFAEQLYCTLKPIQFNRVTHGLPFLGYKVLPQDVRLLGRSKLRFVKKIKIAVGNLQMGKWDEKTAQNHILPLVAYTLHANTINFRRKIIGQSP